MKFKIDENAPIEVAELLRAEGHDAVTILDQRLGGANDDLLTKECRDEGRVLVTLDTDFADIQRYPPPNHPGIVVFRLGHQSKRHMLSIARRWIALLRTEEVGRRLWVVDEVRVRIHE